MGYGRFGNVNKQKTINNKVKFDETIFYILKINFFNCLKRGLNVFYSCSKI